MDQYSSRAKSSPEFDGELTDGEDNLASQDMFVTTVDVNGKTVSNSSSDTSLTDCSAHEEVSNNGEFLADNVNRYVECTDCESPSSRKLPTINTPEKIIFCVDICEDSESTPFKIVSGETFKPLCMIKRVIQIFMHNKQLLNRNHEFALLVLRSDNVLWLRNFTRDPREVISVIDDLCNINAEPGEFFNMSDLFDEVYKRTNLPSLELSNITKPPYTVRMILFYSRSNCLPEFHPDNDHSKDLLSSEFFTVDVVYVHEDVSELNKCPAIFHKLSELDVKGYSYMFHVTRDATKLHNSMAKLLAHPLQRPIQKNASYTLPDPQAVCT